MTNKDELLAELIRKDPTGLVDGLNKLLVANGLKPYASANTLLYRKASEPRAAIRVVESSNVSRAEFSFPKNYWNLHQEMLRKMLDDVPVEFLIPVGGRYGQQSAGRVEINNETNSLIGYFIETAVSENGKYTSPDTEGTHGPLPIRKSVFVNRILRDSEVTGRVKSAHDHKCQICGVTLELPRGKRYAEGHHIKPLGEPHNGPDIESNVICVCPNCHVLLDYGAIKLSPEIIHNMQLSLIASEYLEYHNQRIFGDEMI